MGCDSKKITIGGLIIKKILEVLNMAITRLKEKELFMPKEFWLNIVDTANAEIRCRQGRPKYLSLSSVSDAEDFKEYPYYQFLDKSNILKKTKTFQQPELAFILKALEVEVFNKITELRSFGGNKDANGYKLLEGDVYDLVDRNDRVIGSFSNAYNSYNRLPF